MNEKSSVVGDLINFRGLVYSPINENGVVFLFGKVADDLNMYVEEIKPGFPDCIARRFNGKGWERVAIEFEYVSKNFLLHKHNSKECDIIVCWEHDWADCPLEVIELSEVIKDLPNSPIQRPDIAGANNLHGISLEDYLKKHGATPKVQELYKKFIEDVRGISDDIWVKVGEKVVTLYSPERVFAYTRTRKTTIPLNFFTGTEKIEGLNSFGNAKGGEKWGKLIIKSEADYDKAIFAARESFKRIKTAIKNNENTGWY
ncbi:MAG: hypothetical protein AB1633_11795, partial [Elusimicrobiota bacterium]